MPAFSFHAEVVNAEAAQIHLDGSLAEERGRHTEVGHLGRVRRGLLVGSTVSVLLVCCVFVFSRGSRKTPTFDGIDYATELYDDSSSALAKDAYGLPGMPPAASTNPADDAGTNPAPTSVNDIVTLGATCDQNEELLLGVCYMNCSLLTQGRFPIRSAPNVCCNKMPCLTPSQVDSNGIFPGSGYIVGGKGAGSYPHAPGGCSGNEEMHLGMCYKKCALLTDNLFPKRVMANTCCKASPCWNPFNLKTSGTGACTGFGVGGGLSSEEKCPHKPAAS